MKVKLNLTIEKEIIQKGKAFARKHGVSFSKLVEELLDKIVHENQDTFSSKWRGQFRVAEKNDSRYQKLKERYLE